MGESDPARVMYILRQWKNVGKKPDLSDLFPKTLKELQHAEGPHTIPKKKLLLV